MLQGWTMEGLVEARRRELLAEAAASQMKARARAKTVVPLRPTPFMAVSRPANSTVRPERGSRPLGQRVGTWLIHAGTRMGGAAMRTS